MFTLRIAFPSAVKSTKVIIFEWPIKSDVHELTWEGLINKLCDHTKAKRGKFFVSWHDGEEYCTISTTESLQDAIRTMRYSKPQTPPTFFVAPVIADDDKQQLSAFFGGCSPEELPKDFREQVKRNEASMDPDVNLSSQLDISELVCASCGKRDWTDDKYTCVVCPNRTFCAECYRNQAHPFHPAFITRSGAEFPNRILHAIMATATNMRTEDSNSDYQSESEPEQCSASAIDRGYAVTQAETPESAPIDSRVTSAIEQLRDMGFEHDYSHLYQLAVAECGDVPSIVERLMD